MRRIDLLPRSQTSLLVSVFERWAIGAWKQPRKKQGNAQRGGLKVVTDVDVVA